MCAHELRLNGSDKGEHMMARTLPKALFRHPSKVDDGHDVHGRTLTGERQ